MRRFIASGFGAGLLLPALRRGDAAGSGTLGALVGLAGAGLLAGRGWLVGAAVALGMTLLALWSSRPFTEQGDDPGWITIDEVAGMLVAGIGLAGWPLVVAFVVFRLADITKRFPGVAAAERLGGTVGVTADDLVAGLWGLGAGWLSMLLLPA